MAGRADPETGRRQRAPQRRGRHGLGDKERWIFRVSHDIDDREYPGDTICPLVPLPSPTSNYGLGMRTFFLSTLHRQQVLVSWGLGTATSFSRELGLLKRCPNPNRCTKERGCVTSTG